jgi:fatty acid desaturase
VSDTADIARAERGPLAQLRRDHLRPVHSVLNVAQLALADALLVAWFWLGHAYLPLVVYVPLSLVACVIHQRAMSEWIHEAAHYCLTRSRRWNDVLGNLLSGIWFALPVGVYRASHTAHHRADGFFTDDDPETVFLDVETRPEFRRAILRDLVGGTMVVQYRRFRAEQSKGGGGLGLRIVFALCLLGLVAAMIAIGRVDVIVLYYGSLVTLYPLLNRLRTYVQHARLDATGHVMVAGSEISRTTDCGLVDRVLWTSPRLLYHDEHHRYPYLPWRALVAMHEPSDDVNRYVTRRWPVLRAIYRALPRSA